MQSFMLMTSLNLVIPPATSIMLKSIDGLIYPHTSKAAEKHQTVPVHSA
jgi:hypothetical protein